MRRLCQAPTGATLMRADLVVVEYFSWRLPNHLQLPQSQEASDSPGHHRPAIADRRGCQPGAFPKPDDVVVDFSHECDKRFWLEESDLLVEAVPARLDYVRVT